MEIILFIIIILLLIIIAVLLNKRNKNNVTDFDKYVNHNPIHKNDIFKENEIIAPDPRSVYYKIHEKEINANKLTNDYSTKNIDIEDKTSIFYDKNVVITGTFNTYSRDDIAAFIHSKGGARRSSITSATDIVIIGSISPGPAKLLKIEEILKSGSKLQVIQEDEFIEIIKK